MQIIIIINKQNKQFKRVWFLPTIINAFLLFWNAYIYCTGADGAQSIEEHRTFSWFFFSFPNRIHNKHILTLKTRIVRTFKFINQITYQIGRYYWNGKNAPHSIKNNSFDNRCLTRQWILISFDMKTFSSHFFPTKEFHLNIIGSRAKHPKMFSLSCFWSKAKHN